MKTLKNLLVMFLVVASICAIIVIPANAVPYVDYSASDRGSETGYVWSTTLSSHSTTATASITVEWVSTGFIPATLSASTSGYAYTVNGHGLPFTKNGADDHVRTLTVSRTCNATVATGEIIGAECTYTAMGKTAGMHLKVGDIW